MLIHSSPRCADCSHDSRPALSGVRILLRAPVRCRRPGQQQALDQVAHELRRGAGEGAMHAGRVLRGGAAVRRHRPPVARRPGVQVQRVPGPRHAQHEHLRPHPGCSAPRLRGRGCGWRACSGARLLPGCETGTRGWQVQGADGLAARAWSCVTIILIASRLTTKAFSRTRMPAWYALATCMAARRVR